MGAFFGIIMRIKMHYFLFPLHNTFAHEFLFGG